MILETYQSTAVAEVLKSGNIYRAKPSISFKREYSALIDMLKLNCECPVFAVIKGRKQNTGGRVSGAVRLRLNVPDELIRLTEYKVWADFLYTCKFSKPGDYTKLRPDCEEISIRKYGELIKDIKEQRAPEKYSCPQAIIEEIRPEWLVSSKQMHGSAGKGRRGISEKFFNIFRK